MNLGDQVQQYVAQQLAAQESLVNSVRAQVEAAFIQADAGFSNLVSDALEKQHKFVSIQQQVDVLNLAVATIESHAKATNFANIEDLHNIDAALKSFQAQLNVVGGGSSTATSHTPGLVTDGKKAGFIPHKDLKPQVFKDRDEDWRTWQD